jgi:hypothetical protein
MLQAIGSPVDRCYGSSDVPFKSQAQRRKFAELLVEGKISPETFEEWNRETGSKRLPKRVKRKAKTSKVGSQSARSTSRRKSAKR